MGGNLILNGQTSERIDLLKTPREDVLFSVRSLIGSVQNWLCCDMLVPSGSSRLLMDETISESFLLRHKSSFGDIDLMIPVEYRDLFESGIENINIEGWTYLGGKRSSGQFITLWENTLLFQKIQVDFEFVEYCDGVPTEWSRFSRWSDERDISTGVRGVYHKLFLRALTANTVQTFLLPCGTSEVSNLYAFSVARGLRSKYSTIDGLVFVPLDVSESEYITDVGEIQKKLTGVSEYSEDFWSFVGCVTQISQTMSVAEISNIRMGFLDLLFGSRSQCLYRDKQLDKIEKSHVVRILDSLLDGVIHAETKKEVDPTYSESI